MATSTTKLGLIKPDFTDVVDITDLNSNADDIDAAVGSTIVTSTTRPVAPYAGQVVYETDTEKSFVWTGTEWKPAGGGGGNVADDVIQPNSQTISNNFTFETGQNGVSAGPVTIASGVTVTVPVGSAWSIV
jgi:hypothetical protein